MDLICRNSLRHTETLLTASGYRYHESFVVGSSHIGTAREDALWEAWFGLPEKPTHFLWIDSDMGWNALDVLQMIRHDLKFVAGAGMKKQDKPVFCASLVEPINVDERTGCIEAETVGMAFTLMKVSVIEQMIARFDDLHWYNRLKDRHEWALFLDLMSVSGRRLTEDTSFCERWRSIGGTIWCDPQITLSHLGRKDYRGRFADFLERQ